VAWTSPAGFAPSVHPLWEQKLYSVVSVPLGVILKTVPLRRYSRWPRPRGCPVQVPIGGLDQPREGGVAPSVPSKLNSVVKVCAGRAIAVAAHSTKNGVRPLPQFSLPNVATNSANTGRRPQYSD
jgi:hypothetical protein